MDLRHLEDLMPRSPVRFDPIGPLLPWLRCVLSNRSWAPCSIISRTIVEIMALVHPMAVAFQPATVIIRMAARRALEGGIMDRDQDLDRLWAWCHRSRASCPPPPLQHLPACQCLRLRLLVPMESWRVRTISRNRMVVLARIGRRLRMEFIPLIRYLLELR